MLGVFHSVNKYIARSFTKQTPYKDISRNAKKHNDKQCGKTNKHINFIIECEYERIRYLFESHESE